jgi:hypothetical protein
MAKRPSGKGRLIAAFDCTQEYPPDRYFGSGQVRVVETAAGRYREAEGKPMSRFGYRFTVDRVGRPHLAVIRYPDDKRRYMCVMDGTCYDLTTGVFTDWAQPVSGRMLEIEQVFWPRWNDCSIVFMTWGEGEPAAVAAVEIHELDDLPALAVPGDPGDGSRREIGIQYEDPCGTATSEGALDREEWMDRIVAYARYTGQKLLVYPLAWYHGPQFPSQREPSGALEGVAARDRKQYVRWTSHPDDWYARLLGRFGREGLEFQGSLTLMRLGSLMARMNTDLDAIRAGADTINNMLWNDQVQAGTGDWTPLYNVRNFSAIAARLGEGQRVSPFDADLLPQWADGERSGPYHAGPIFNPLHPVVQEAVLGFAGEIAERYAPYPAFKGISFNLFPSTMLWYGSLHSGYDDYTIRLFEQETGIRVPVDAAAPDRFSRRYAFLTHVCRPAWVAWRCRKVRDLVRSIRDEVRSRRADLRVAITLWDETVVPGVLGEVGAGHQVGARLSNAGLYREAGLDLNLYRDEPGIEVDLGMGNTRDRGGHGPMPAGGVNRPLEAMTMFRDHDFLDRETLDATRAQARPAVFIFNCWVEAWGEHVWWRPEADDPNVAQLGVMDGKPADGILRANSEYPPDGFWWDSQSRIVPAFPGGPHFMEPYAHALAELDACRITRGGLFLDKAHSELIRGFAQAFRALPRERFDTVGTTTDPVAMRTLVRDGIRYLYLVNRQYYPIDVEVTFSRSPRQARDLATGRAVRAAKRWRVTLGPYELRAFTIAPDIEITDFKAHPPKDIARSLAEEGEAVLHDVGRVRAAGQFIPWMDQLEQGIRSAMAEGRLAWLRRAITGYAARKCREVAIANRTDHAD